MNEFKVKCITIRKDQEEFLKQEQVFRLSKFVQFKLDEYIKYRKDYKEFMETKVNGDENEKTN